MRHAYVSASVRRHFGVLRVCRCMVTVPGRSNNEILRGINFDLLVRDVANVSVDTCTFCFLCGLLGYD
jgi:hypothetical protein